MLNVTVENIGELAVVECEGRIVQSEAAFKLRKAVTSQTDARIVVLELSEVHAIEGGGTKNFVRYIGLFFTFYAIAMGFSFQNSMAVLRELVTLG